MGLGSARESVERFPLLGGDNSRGRVLLEVRGEVLVEGEQRLEVAGEAAQRLVLAVDHALARAPELAVADVVPRVVGLVVAGVLGELDVAVGEAEALAEAGEGDVAHFGDGFGERGLLFERVEGGVFEGGAVGNGGRRRGRGGRRVGVECLFDTFVGFLKRFGEMEGFFFGGSMEDGLGFFFFFFFFVVVSFFFGVLIYNLRIFGLFRLNDNRFFIHGICRLR